MTELNDLEVCTVVLKIYNHRYFGLLALSWHVPPWYILGPKRSSHIAAL